MKRRRNRQLARQRLTLGVLGAVVLALAVFGLLVSAGIVDQVTAWVDGSVALMNPVIDRSLRANSIRYQVGGVIVGVLLVVLGVTWLRRQIPPLRHHQRHDVPNTVGEIAGTNTVDGGALAAALAEDLERHPQVDRAVAEVRSDDETIRLQLSVDDMFALPELRSVIEPAVQRVTTVGDFDRSLTTQIDVRFTEHGRTLS